jgi:hypothetical protein
VAFTLRQNARTELFEAGIQDVVQRIEEIRGPQAAEPQPAPPADTTAPAQPDTAEAGGGA